MDISSPTESLLQWKVIAAGLSIVFVMLLVTFVTWRVVKHVKQIQKERPVLVRGVRKTDVATVEDDVEYAFSPYKMIPRQMLKPSRYTNGWSYSFWFKVTDWNYKYGEPKHLFHRGDREGFSMSPGVWLHPEQNTLMIRVDTRGNDDTRLNESMSPLVTNDFTESKCDVLNIPIQRWIHVVLVLHNRTLDVFVNGKLRRSCQYEHPPVNNEGDLHITDKGGFSGHIADLQYFNINISPEKVFSIYSDGVSEPSYWERLRSRLGKAFSNRKCTGGGDY